MLYIETLEIYSDNGENIDHPPPNTTEHTLQHHNNIYSHTDETYF